MPIHAALCNGGMRAAGWRIYPFDSAAGAN
jgi:hypothetical protein